VPACLGGQFGGRRLQRWLWTPGSQCLPAWAANLAAAGYSVGYYVRKGSDDLLANLTWFETWLDDMAAVGGNAQYVDTFARTYNGKPTDILKLIASGRPAADVIVEGWNDLYPFAGLLSGYHQGYDWCNSSTNTTSTIWPRLAGFAAVRSSRWFVF